MNKALTYCALLAMATAIGGCGHGESADTPSQDSAEATVAPTEEDSKSEDYVEAAEMLLGGDYRDSVPAQWTDSMPDDSLLSL